VKTVLITLLAILLGACSYQSSGSESNSEKNKIFYLNSYHPGYKSSDDILKGFERGMEGQTVDTEVLYMNTKKLDSLAIVEKAQQALRLIERFQPDIIVVSDDNAVKYVVEPFLKDGPYPVIFTGVNWSCQQYGLPTEHVTGILEILPVEATLDTLRNYFPDIKTVAVLSEESTSEQKNIDVITPILEEKGFEVEYELVDNYAAWKETFIGLNQTADAIFIPTNGAVKNWPDTSAELFVQNHIQVPVFTCDDFMMRYAVFGLTKRPEEMGEWAATKALEVLRGTSVSDIQVSQNSSFQAWINYSLADRIGFIPSQPLKQELHNAEEI